MTPANIKTAFADQSNACVALGSPFMGQLMRLCATQDWPDCAITQRIFTWQGDISPAAQSVPLRFAGALHALHLQGHAELNSVYPPHQSNDAQLWQAICAAMISDEAHINAWLETAPQTNEVRRSAVLIAVGHFLAHRYGFPIRTSELGASGGLNLHWDRYALKIGSDIFGAHNPALTLHPDWTGAKPPSAAPDIVARAGVDLNPLNPANPDDALRLQAYLWPDQPERLQLTRAAMRIANTQVAKGDAIDWLRTRLNHNHGQTHLIYTTVAWQYFPDAKKAEGANLIAAAGALATTNNPLAWFGMENDGGTKGAALTLRLWPEDITLNLGRADFHGRWIDWAAP